jgi:hypothetical protein
LSTKVRTSIQAVPELLNSLPNVEQVISHGSPCWKVSGKTFAHWAINHHGDGRAALWLASPPGVQPDLVTLNSEAYFVPPYVGPKGWLGMDLNKNLAWEEIITRIVEAWAHCAPVAIAETGPGKLEAAPPDAPMSPEDLNPMLGERAQTILSGLSKLCRNLPETMAEDELASANWRANKRPFVRGEFVLDRLNLMFWVGAEQQGMLTEDPRYSLPLYYANSGWINLDVQDHVHWPEVESLLEFSYRHVALKRMLKTLDERPA